MKKLISIVLSILPIVANAQEGPAIPFVACVEETGEIFRGTAFGADAGPLNAVSENGVSCEGEWKRLPLGLGVASFTCDDGRTGTTIYHYFDTATGTAIGDGSLQDGSPTRFWSGYRLEDYFKTKDPSERERMACQPEQMLLS